MFAKIPHFDRHFAIYAGILCFSKAHLGWESIDVASIILLLFFRWQCRRLTQQKVVFLSLLK